MTGLTIYYYKTPVVGQEEIGIKMSNDSLTLKRCDGHECADCMPMSQNVMTQAIALDTVIYSTLHTAAARKDGVHKKIQYEQKSTGTSVNVKICHCLPAALH
jgi:hypothetical protein